MRRVAALLALALLALGLARLGYLQWAYRSRPFTPEAWAVADPETRGCMVHDLIASRRLVGMARRDVHQLLGGSEPYYVAGAGSWFALPMEFSYCLRLEFDRVDNVGRAFLDD